MSCHVISQANGSIGVLIIVSGRWCGTGKCIITIDGSMDRWIDRWIDGSHLDVRKTQLQHVPRQDKARQDKTHCHQVIKPSSYQVGVSKKGGRLDKGCVHLRQMKHPSYSLHRDSRHSDSQYQGTSRHVTSSTAKNNTTQHNTTYHATTDATPCTHSHDPIQSNPIRSNPIQYTWRRNSGEGLG